MNKPYQAPTAKAITMLVEAPILGPTNSVGFKVETATNQEDEVELSGEIQILPEL